MTRTIQQQEGSVLLKRIGMFGLDSTTAVDVAKCYSKGERLGASTRWGEKTNIGGRTVQGKKVTLTIKGVEAGDRSMQRAYKINSLLLEKAFSYLFLHFYTNHPF